MERYYLVVSGIVQGVGFRYTCMTIAKSLGLSGYVRNCTDNGNVEMEIQGSKAAIDEFLKEILKERRFIKIFDYQIKKIALKDDTNFTVRY